MMMWCRCVCAIDWIGLDWRVRRSCVSAAAAEPKSTKMNEISMHFHGIITKTCSLK